MPRHRRLKIEGGLFFYTVALVDRGGDLLIRRIERLRRAYTEVEKRLPFETVAICILPDHIHALWQLPGGKSLSDVIRLKLSGSTRGPTCRRAAGAEKKNENGQFYTDSPSR